MVQRVAVGIEVAAVSDHSRARESIRIGDQRERLPSAVDKGLVMRRRGWSSDRWTVRLRFKHRVLWQSLRRSTDRDLRHDRPEMTFRSIRLLPESHRSVAAAARGGSPEIEQCQSTGRGEPHRPVRPIPSRHLVSTCTMRPCVQRTPFRRQAPLCFYIPVPGRIARGASFWP
jgi:hypothetical protein